MLTEMSSILLLAVMCKLQQRVPGKEMSSDVHHTLNEISVEANL